MTTYVISAAMRIAYEKHVRKRVGEGDQEAKIKELAEFIRSELKVKEPTGESAKLERGGK